MGGCVKGTAWHLTGCLDGIGKLAEVGRRYALNRIAEKMPLALLVDGERQFWSR